MPRFRHRQGPFGSACVDLDIPGRPDFALRFVTIDKPAELFPRRVAPTRPRASGRPEGDVEGRADAALAADFDRPAKAIAQALDDGQADTVA